jgi:hypothetical protein
MNNTIVYLIGHYGVGKLTIARQICALAGARLFDNHLVNNVVFSLIPLDGKTPIPETAWDLIWTIRQQAVTAIAEIAPEDWSYVMTNALMEGNVRDQRGYDQIVALAAARGSTFVPVLLSASDAAHAARVAAPDRAERFKQTDVESALHKRQTSRLLRIEHPNRLDLDTTDLPPTEAARLIIDHAERAR